MTTSVLVEPTYYNVPDYYQTLGPEVGELNALAGFAPDPEQQLALDATFGMDRRGRSAAFEVAVIACRQNLKTGFFKQSALGKVFILERPLFVWSAHEFRTSQEAFRDLTVLIESTPTLDRQVRRIYRGNGDESIELLGGQRIIFKARTKSGGRGLTGDDVGLDEAFALLPTHMGALLPTLSARPDPQVLYGSSAGMVMSDVLREIRDRGRSGKDRRLAYLEWTAPDPAEACDTGEQCDHALTAKGCGCDKREMIQLANPQAGRRIAWDYIEAERRALPPAEFGRERMGWWDDAGGGNTNLFPLWSDSADPESEAESAAAFGVDATPDRAFASISVVGPREDGLVHGALVQRDRGLGWVVERCVHLDAAHGPTVFAVDGSSPAASLIDEMVARGLTVEVLGARDMGRASAWLVDAVSEGTLKHKPGEEPLDEAVAGAKKVNVGDGLFKFGRRASSVDISPLVALAAAAHVLPSLIPLDDITVAFL